MKVYEYLAAGLPVVATPLPALAGVAEVATRAPTPTGSRGCSSRRSPRTVRERRAERSRAAAAHSWDRRLQEIADRGRGAVRDLLVTTHTPVLRSGQAVRTYGVARALATHRELDLLYARFGAEEPDAAFRAIPGIELHEALPSRGPRRLLAYARRAPAGVPDGLRARNLPELASAAERARRERAGAGA